MKYSSHLAVFLAVLAGLVSFAGPAVAVDPLQSDPGHHSLLFENQHFRVDRGKFGPGEIAADFFDAEGVVIVALTPMRMRLYLPDGTTADPPASTAGTAFWAPPGRIRPQNMLDQPIEFVIVFPRGTNGSSPRSGTDALEADPGHYTLEFENDQVRVLRVLMEPHAASVMHGHPAHVAVLLTAGRTLMHLPDGKSFVSSRKAGDAVNAPAGEHLPENLLDEPTEVVVIERK